MPISSLSRWTVRSPRAGIWSNVPLCPLQHPTEFEIQILKGSLKLLAMATWLAEPGQDPSSHVLLQPQAERWCLARGHPEGHSAEEPDLGSLRWKCSLIGISEGLGHQGEPQGCAGLCSSSGPRVGLLFFFPLIGFSIWTGGETPALVGLGLPFLMWNEHWPHSSLLCLTSTLLEALVGFHLSSQRPSRMCVLLVRQEGIHKGRK